MQRDLVPRHKTLYLAASHTTASIEGSSAPDYQDRAISPQRDKDVRLNSVATLPSGETSHSCNSSSSWAVTNAIEKINQPFAFSIHKVIAQHGGTA